MKGAAEIVELQPGESARIGDMEATAVQVPHAPELQCFGWKLAARDATVIYSGDTSAAPDVMVPFAQDADLLIHDAFSEAGLAARLEQLPTERRALTIGRMWMTHAEVREVGRIAEAAGVRQLVLTAILPTEDPEVLRERAAGGFSGPVTVAYDGLVVKV